MTPRLSIIMPSYNEADNARPLCERLVRALSDLSYEVIFVDHSTDGTEKRIAEIARENPRIRVIHHEGRRGLASAVVDGIAAACGDVLCVLDADLQHPPEALPALVEALDHTGADLVVASRYIPGGAYDAFTRIRGLVSWVARGMARILLHRARIVSDPLSGFFAFRRSVVDGIWLRPLGYKILLEVLVRGRLAKVVEVPYRFEVRGAGQSKLTARQNGEYLTHLVRLILAHPDDLRFVRFCLVGASGVLVNMAILWGLFTFAGFFYLYAGAVATVAATTWNFVLNSTFTWQDRRAVRVHQLSVRYLQYWIVTGAGSIAQITILYLLTVTGVPYLLSNLCGIFAAVAWNFRMNAQWTWKPSSPPLQRVMYREKTHFVIGHTKDMAKVAVEKRREFVRHLREGPIPRVRITRRMDSGADPKVSVIIPTSDGTRTHHLAKLLQQIQDQPFRPLEVIVVAGDRRQGRAINTAAAIARGEILLTMDDDTRLGDPCVFEKLCMALERDPTIGIAGVASVIPDDAPWLAQRAMRELPRRSSPVVRSVTDSDMAEHPCLAIRKDLFYQIGGENELIPRGLDPYLRREVRRLGYRVVVIPDAWIHHLLPSTYQAILRQYFRNGMGAAYVKKFHPECVIEQAEAHGEDVPGHTSLAHRALRYVGRMGRAVFAARWIYLGTLVTYGAGYTWGMLRLRKDSL